MATPGSSGGCKGGGAARAADGCRKSAEVDHRVPLFRVWSEHQGTPWPELLTYWVYRTSR